MTWEPRGAASAGAAGSHRASSTDSLQNRGREMMVMSTQTDNNQL